MREVLSLAISSAVIDQLASTALKLASFLANVTALIVQLWKLVRAFFFNCLSHFCSVFYHNKQGKDHSTSHPRSLKV